jgi:hypothetical protein
MQKCYFYKSVWCLNKRDFVMSCECFRGAGGDVDGWSDMLKAGMLWVWVPMSGFVFNLPNPLNRIMVIWFTQPLSEMSTRRSFWGVERGRCVRLTTHLPSVSRLSRQCRSSMSHASMACYGASFTFYFLLFTLCECSQDVFGLFAGSLGMSCTLVWLGLQEGPGRVGETTLQEEHL